MAVRTRVLAGAVVASLVTVFFLVDGGDPTPKPKIQVNESEALHATTKDGSKVDHSRDLLDLQAVDNGSTKSGLKPDLRLARHRTVQRSLSRFAKEVGMDLPPLDGLSESKWQALQELLRSTAESVNHNQSKRMLLLVDLMAERQSKGLLERVSDNPKGITSLTSAKLRELHSRGKPEFLGQLVTSCYTDDGRYVSRVNAGDHAGIDAYSDQIRTHATLLVAGVNQIVESEDPVNQSKKER